MDLSLSQKRGLLIVVIAFVFYVCLRTM